jgi:hypothetical protein
MITRPFLTQTLHFLTYKIINPIGPQKVAPKRKITAKKEEAAPLANSFLLDLILVNFP